MFEGSSVNEPDIICDDSSPVIDSELDDELC